MQDTNAFWYNPRDGQWRVGGTDHPTPQPFDTGIPSGAGAPDVHFYPAGEQADGNDWVLVLNVEMNGKERARCYRRWNSAG